MMDKLRKTLCLILAILMLAALIIPVFAEENTFVPSITYKDGPEIEEAEMNGEDMAKCLVVTSIKAARNKTTDVYQHVRDLLLEVYEDLDSGDMVLPYEDDREYVVRELVDVSFRKTTCLEVEHPHEEELNKEGITITIAFDMDVYASTDVYVFSYHNGEWDPAISVTNNGDGTVDVELEHLCPVAFCVERGAEDNPPQTGDTMGQDLILWIVLLAASLVGIVVLVINRRKFVG